MTTFNALGLSGGTLKGVLAAGYSSPTPIQSESIPVVLSGQDLIGCAQTGTGKTAAFVLPMLQRLSESRPSRGRPIRALVVAPTRELALQVENAVRTYGKFAGFKSASIFGGVAIPPQLQKLRRGVDIVVATPGRLLDLMNRGDVDLSQVEVLVLDEADRMFDMGFINDIRKIVAQTPADRQTLLFSATMPKAIEALTRSIQTDPAFIEVGERRNPAETVLQQVCRVRSDAKMDLLSHVLRTEDADNIIVFSRTKHRADRIMKKLNQQGYAATVMHSNRTQSQRQRALEGFRNGTFQILVATDIAARGIDVDSISHVINYDTPAQAEDYIHRIGRTGRAESTGEAITFVARDEEGYLRDIERHTGKRLLAKEYADFDMGVPQRDHAESPDRTRQRSEAGRSGRDANSGRRKGSGSGRARGARNVGSGGSGRSGNGGSGRSGNGGNGRAGNGRAGNGSSGGGRTRSGRNNRSSSGYAGGARAKRKR
ncbi:MAG: DEAD/DEAH box helicase [Rhodothermales bacterium]